MGRRVNVSARGQSLSVRLGCQIAPRTRFRNAIAFLFAIYITRLRGKLGQNSSLGKSHTAIPHHNVPRGSSLRVRLDLILLASKDNKEELKE